MSNIMARLTERAGSLGVIGKYLLLQNPETLLTSDFGTFGIVGQLTHIERVMSRNRTGIGTSELSQSVINATQLKCCAASVLCCDFTVQVAVNESVILALIRGSLPKLQADVNAPPNIDIRREHTQRNFPLKPNACAEDKANVFLSDVVEGLRKTHAAHLGVIASYSKYMYGMTNDQAAMCVLQYMGMLKYYPDAADLAVRLCKYPVEAKNLTVVLKGLGLNGTRSGAVVCEAQCLQGKGVSPIDMTSMVLERVGDAGRKNTPDLFRDAELRQAIRHVLLNELQPGSVEFDHPEVFWSKRWLWCVNGGHSKTVGKIHPKWGLDIEGRIHRRVAAENWQTNPLYAWDGDVFVSAAEKTEPGKTRLILACDTVSYVCFEHILRPVEKVWMNKRTLLDPGSSGSIGIVDRMRKLKGTVNVMMDYDAFNEAHTIRAQEIVFEELIDITGYDPVLGEKLVSSFSKMTAYVRGEPVGRISATMMSGHRGTTFINSVLNSAYIYAAAPDIYKKFDSLHTGDDVVARFSSYSDIDKLLKALRERGVKLNPMKQSIGKETMEFLRMAVTPGYAIGYLPRALASLVGGNWVNPDPLSPVALITTIATTTRSCINRAGMDVFSDIAAFAASRRVGIGAKVLKRIFSGQIALGGGPIFGNVAGVKTITFSVPRELKEEARAKLADAKAYATEAYLSNHLSDVELRALSSLEMGVKETMMEASYAKSLIGITQSDQLGVSYNVSGTRMMTGSFEASELNRRKTVEGVLLKYPILMILKEQIGATLLVSLLDMLGYRSTPQTASFVAWGGEYQGKVFRGILPYSDAAKLCKKCLTGIIYVTYNIFM